MIQVDTKEKFFFFHTINSFQVGDKFYIDFCGYRDNQIVDDFYLQNLENRGVSQENKAKFMRLIVDLKTKKTLLEKFDVQVELPSINKSFGGEDYAYFYGIHSTKGSKELGNSILKYGLENKSQIIWQDQNLLPGEPIFVSSPNSNSEDDGILLVVCFDQTLQSSCLIILSARSMTEIARSYTPNFIPASLHGSFYKS